jgi:phage-related protein
VGNWLSNLADWIWGGVKDLAKELADKLAGLFGVFTGFFHLLRQAWNAVYDGWKLVRTATGSLIGEIYSTLKWFFQIKVPQLISFAINTLRVWTTSFINTVRNALTHAINLLRNWAVNAVNAIRALISQVQRWVSGLLAKVWATLTWTYNLVHLLLTSSERLATWLVASMFTALWRFIRPRIVTFAAYMWRVRSTLLGGTLKTVEAILARIF